MINNRDKENAISVMRDLADLSDIYSHLPATVPTERRKAFLISIINQYKFNEHGHDEIPNSLPCPSPYLCTDRMRGPSGLQTQQVDPRSTQT
jgi:hypothetical protein